MQKWTTVAVVGVAVIVAACSGGTSGEAPTTTVPVVTSTSTPTTTQQGSNAAPTTSPAPPTTAPTSTPSADDLAFKTQFPIPSLAGGRVSVANEGDDMWTLELVYPVAMKPQLISFYDIWAESVLTAGEATIESGALWEGPVLGGTFASATMTETSEAGGPEVTVELVWTP